MKTATIFVAFLASVFAFPENVFEFEQPLEDGGKHWALLVAGSNGYFNYRHQADVCHAYQVLHSHGIPDEQIVVMMYDDIADNKENPVKGNIINRPNGPNVYEGVLKDYTGKDVNPETFLNVLKGKSDEVNGGKVINSGPNDYVFVNFVDHGAPGILGFGDNFSDTIFTPAKHTNGTDSCTIRATFGSELDDVKTICGSGPNDHVFVNFVDHGAPGILGFGEKRLKAKELLSAIMYMNENNRYKKMVFYVEACESGSVFYDLLPKDINVFATTASNPHESSYACYFDKKRKTYLGDVYSVKWMEDSDKEDLTMETLKKQFAITKSEVNTSHVMEYGDLKMGDMTVGEFQGTQSSASATPTAKDPCEEVKSEDVPLEILRRRLNLAETKAEAAEVMERIRQMETERRIVDKTMKFIVGLATNHKHLLSTKVMEHRHHIKNWNCYEEMVDHVQETCSNTLNIPVNDYALRKLYMFVNMCEENVPVETMKEAVSKVCEYEN